MCQGGIDKACIIELSDKERHLIEEIREMGYGRLEVVVKAKEPIYIEWQRNRKEL
ncbi:hypothetical protein LCGC14_0983580 [marine sediment metagenome]|uniref:Uncharacterized protein n=1 Tax=marine sediment metagenome TaxID=412755 RepID=A0A0F9QR76_9ZZZZ